MSKTKTLSPRKLLWNANTCKTTGVKFRLALYLDDCAYHKVLLIHLQQAGFKVTYPALVGTTSAKDSVHLEYAKNNGLSTVTKNAKDFLDLHRNDPNHHGILAVYQDNDTSRDMAHADIVRAIGNLEQSGVPIAGNYHVLNHWRFS